MKYTKIEITSAAPVAPKSQFAKLQDRIKKVLSGKELTLGFKVNSLKVSKPLDADTDLATVEIPFTSKEDLKFTDVSWMGKEITKLIPSSYNYRIKAEGDKIKIVFNVGK